MTSSFLHGGARSVVAGVARVGDDAAFRVAVAHHEALSRGNTPAAAPEDEPAPFVCFGAGW